MIHEDRYVHSWRQYAVDLSTFRAIHYGGELQDGHSWERWLCGVDAVWFRGLASAPKACMGVLKWTSSVHEVNAVEALTRHRDGTYGGTCFATWNGRGLWTSETTLPEENQRFVTTLAPALARFSEVPAGYSGWWTFRAVDR